MKIASFPSTLAPVKCAPDKQMQERFNGVNSAVTSESHGVNLAEFGVKDSSERLKYYRKFLYEKGDITDVDKERAHDFKLNKFDRFRYRTRYFNDSGIIGSKEFVDRVYQQFKHYYITAREKKPKAIRGPDGVYSLKRLSETIP